MKIVIYVWTDLDVKQSKTSDIDNNSSLSFSVIIPKELAGKILIADNFGARTLSDFLENPPKKTVKEKGVK